MPRPRTHLLSAASEPDFASMWTPKQRPPPLDAFRSDESSKQAARALVQGPTPRSNWLIPGTVLCGDRTSAGERAGDIAAAFASCGARTVTFVCLQTKPEVGSYYIDRVRKAFHANAPGIEPQFEFFPIVDQNVASDDQTAMLALRLYRRLEEGEALYIHCRGGHGRTGTVCALLLGLVFNLAGPEALALYQALHDCRGQPVFYSHDYAPDEANAVALFPPQREQVVRLLRADGDDAPIAPRHELSEQYGKGASKYDASLLEEWKELGERAATAAKANEWADAAELLARCVALRPDWRKGHSCLATAVRRAGAGVAEVEAALRTGIAACGPSDAAELEAELKRLAIAAPAAAPSAADGADADAEAVEEAAAEAAAAAAAASSSSAAPPASRGGRKAFGKRSERLPNLVLMVGLPGAGKSTFSGALKESAPDVWEVLSQDEMGSRGAVEDALLQLLKRGKRVIVDKCSVTRADRKTLLDLALRPAGCVCVFVDTPRAQCEERAAGRTDHPGIRFGGGKLPIASFADKLEAPAATEGFDAVHCVTSEAEVAALLTKWGAAPPQPPPLGLFKFPRTRHVLNTGGTAVTRDDLVMDAADARRFFDGSTVVVAEEKVDGANLGFSLSATYEVQAQNRSHYVNQQTHAQFKPLGQWIDEHSWALCQLLQPEVEVLFGEWCYAKHSVAYSRLPGYFVAFDIYNKRTGKFCAAAERDRRLEGLGIPQVRQVAARAFGSKEELLALLETRSAYTDGFVEGVYLRIDDAAHCVARGKCVRPDFIQGIEEHWMAGGLVKNAVALGGADEEV